MHTSWCLRNHLLTFLLFCFSIQGHRCQPPQGGDQEAKDYSGDQRPKGRGAAEGRGNDCKAQLGGGTYEAMSGTGRQSQKQRSRQHHSYRDDRLRQSSHGWQWQRLHPSWSLTVCRRWKQQQRPISATSRPKWQDGRLPYSIMSSLVFLSIWNATLITFYVRVLNTLLAFEDLPSITK